MSAEKPSIPPEEELKPKILPDWRVKVDQNAEKAVGQEAARKQALRDEKAAEAQARVQKSLEL